MHGGNTYTHRVHAERVQAETLMERTKEIARTYGIPREVSPAQGLIEEYWRTAGVIRWLEERIGLLSPEDISWGVVEVTADGGGTGNGGDAELNIAIRETTRKAAPHVLVQLFQRERAHFATLGADLIRLKLETVRDEWAQRNSGVVVMMLRRALERAGLLDDAKQAVEVALADEIKAMLAISSGASQ